ncbi:MAG: hypothetical protein LBR08_01485 [Bacteroidales bacterium]|jgi:hypothetical protein|nr:hypothetical protein [Bacteroidales bacterium]
MSVDHHLMHHEELDKRNPFSVPEGYFDQLQEKVVFRIKKEKKSVFRIRYYKYVAAAACILLFSVWGLLFLTDTRQPATVGENADEEELELWMYDVLDKTTLTAALLNIETSEDILETCCSEEQEMEIIRFLERENITIAAIVHSLENDGGFY